jgi:hypothetical protein
MRFNLAFSASRAYSCLTSAGYSSPKCRRLVYSVCYETVCLRATSATLVRSASRRVATIGSSVERLFFVASSL